LSKSIISFCVLVTLFCGSGAHCVGQYSPMWPAGGTPAPQVLSGGATVPQIMQVVNDNTARVQSLTTSNATIKAAGMPTTLRGSIALERPRRLRIQAGLALTGPEVDIGSNDELFWIWMQRNQPPAVYFCRHDQYSASAAHQQMPIDPEWLIEALGLVTFDSEAEHQGPHVRRDGNVEIRSILPAQDGVAGPMSQLQKITVIDAARGWVLQQHLYNARGERLASVIAQDHHYDAVHQVSLPQRVRVDVPASQLSLEIDLGNVQINALSGDPSLLWPMPSFPGAAPVDLALLRPPGGAPVGQIAPIRENSSTSSVYGTGSVYGGAGRRNQ